MNIRQMSSSFWRIKKNHQLPWVPPPGIFLRKVKCQGIYIIVVIAYFMVIRGIIYLVTFVQLIFNAAMVISWQRWWRRARSRLSLKILSQTLGAKVISTEKEILVGCSFIDHRDGNSPGLGRKKRFSPTKRLHGIKIKEEEATYKFQ